MRVVILCFLCFWISACTQTESSQAEGALSPELIGVRDIFLDSESVEVYRIFPRSFEGEGERGALFHEYPIRKSKTVEAESAKKLANVVWQDYDPSVSPYFCFNPRHGLRVKSGEDQFDLLICFECAQAKVFKNEKQIGDLPWKADAVNALNEALEWDSKQESEERERERAPL